MMADMPAAVMQQQLLGFDLGRLQERVQSFTPVLSVLKDTWTHATWQEICAGKVYLSDEMLNEIIADRISGNENIPLSSLKISCHAENRMGLEAVTKAGNRIVLSGKIKALVHKNDVSYFVYQAKKHSYPGHGINSWLFSTLSLSMVQRLVGKLEVEELPIEIEGNTIRVELSDVLRNSDFGRAEIEGCYLHDILEIKGAEAREGGLLVETALHADDRVKALLWRVLG